MKPEQQEVFNLVEAALERAYASRRMGDRGGRGRVAPASSNTGPVTPIHLLADNGVDILTDAGGNRLLNG